MASIDGLARYLDAVDFPLTGTFSCARRMMWPRPCAPCRRFHLGECDPLTGATVILPVVAPVSGDGFVGVHGPTSNSAGGR